MFFFTVIISYYSQETLQIGFQNPQEKINKCTCNFILPPPSGKAVFTLRSYCVGPQIAMELQRSRGIK